MNMYGYTGNDPVNRFDSFGQKSYVVGRKLDNLVLSALNIGHAFVATNAEYPGDPNATIYSFGKLVNGNLGNVTDESRADPISRDAYENDLEAWKALKRDATKNVSEIRAPDSVVDAVANGVQENNPYAAVPSSDGDSREANSNSAAFGIGNIASQIAGNGPVSGEPFSILLPGGSSHAAGRISVIFNADTGSLTVRENRARTGTRIRRSVTVCVSDEGC